MSYRKQISYLELQENGQRIRGAGYAKLESWEKEEILMVQLRGQGIVSGKKDWSRKDLSKKDLSRKDLSRKDLSRKDWSKKGLSRKDWSKRSLN
jgi:uncharacterized protein YjbI with pentapeptide repeats